jgi:hypothetical protein
VEPDAAAVVAELLLPPQAASAAAHIDTVSIKLTAFFIFSSLKWIYR